MKKKQIITLSLVGVGVLILLGVAIGLGHSVMKYRESDRAYKKYRSQLSKLYKADVFPSQENMSIERENREQLEDWFDALITQLGKDNVSRDDRSPSQFRGRMERAMRALRQQAERGKVRLPASDSSFAFGFELYAGTGRLPNPEDVPRLTEQLIIITRLNKLLFESEVSAIESIKRDVFEESVGPAVDENPRERGRSIGRSRGRTSAGNVSNRNDEGPASMNSQRKNPGIIKSGDMFTTYRFVLTFDTREEAFAKLLNKLASDPMFTLVRSVRVHKDVPDMVALPTTTTVASDAAPAVPARAGRAGGGSPNVSFLFGGGSDAGATSTPQPGQSKTVLGPSHPVSGIEMEIPMQVQMVIDVYKFRRADEAGN